MNIKKIIAAFSAAATVLYPYGTNFMTGKQVNVYAEEHGMGAALPEWIPNDYDSALEFRNTYGATHIRDGLICLVFKESSKNEEDLKLRYDLKTTEGMMNELTHKIYGSSDSNTFYEVVVYYMSDKEGQFSVALTDNQIQVCIEPEDGYDAVLVNNKLAQSSGLDLGGANAAAYYSFEVDEAKNVTETDIYGWLPDCSTEYREYVTKNGAVSSKDNFVVFCLERGIGTGYDWFEADNKEYFKKAYQSDCSMETDEILDGGTSFRTVVYQAVKDGKARLKWEFAPSYDYGSNTVEKNLVAECNIFDEAQKILLDDAYFFDSRFSFEHYSIYSSDLTVSYNSVYSEFGKTKTAVIKSRDELKSFITAYLNEKALNKFLSQYSDTFFQNYVLLLKTYLDPYRGRIMKHGLDCVYEKEGNLIISYTSIIGASLMRTSYFDILKVELPKEEYNDREVIWQDNETLDFDLKRISVIDEDTGEYITIPNMNVLDMFGGMVNYCEGGNPYYWDTEFTKDDWHELSVNEKYLPEGYKLSEKEIKEYSYNSADIIFRVKNTASSDITYSIDRISTISEGLKSENMFKLNTPAVVGSKAELSEELAQFMSDEHQKDILSKYDDAFFEENVLLLNFLIEGTGPDTVKINYIDISDDKISAFYTKPGSDFGICNTEFFCTLQVALPKNVYNNAAVEWKCLGDVNDDNEFGIADLVTLQKWLICSPDTVINDLTKADLCRDRNIDSYDLIMMRKQLFSCARIS